jgi:DNA polymerase I
MPEFQRRWSKKFSSRKPIENELTELTVCLEGGVTGEAVSQPTPLVTAAPEVGDKSNGPGSESVAAETRTLYPLYPPYPPEERGNGHLPVQATLELVGAPPQELAPEPKIIEEPKKGPGVTPLSCSYEYVTEVATAERVVAQLVLAPVVGVDTETIRFQERLPSGKEAPPNLYQDRLRLVQIASSSGTWVFDLNCVPLDLLVPVFTSPGIKVFHNAQFDMAFIHQATGVMPAPAFCTQIADQILRTGQGDKHGLKDIAPHYVGWDVSKEYQLSDWSQEPLAEEQKEYAARDSAVLIALHEKLQTEIASKGLERVMALEMSLLPTVTEMWEKGVYLDWNSWRAAYNLRERDQKAAEVTLSEVLPQYFTQEKLAAALGKGKVSKAHRKALDAGIPLKVNWSSRPQVSSLLKALGVELPLTEKGHITGQMKTDRATLAGAQDEHPLIPLLIAYEAPSSLMSKYGLKWGDYINPTTRCIHASFNQCGTVTGRFSISRPGLHSTPRKGGYRECYRPLPGHVFLIYDWSQVEVRIVAEICGDENLINIFRTGEDIYVSVAIKLFKIVGRAPTDEERQKAKAVVLGQNYGQSANGLVKYAAEVCQIDISKREAQKLINDYFSLFPKLREWQKREEEKLETLGSFDTETPLGRRRTVRVGSYGGAESGKEVLNSPIQGAGADCLKLAMVLLYESRQELPGASVVLPVHDELVYQVPIDQVELGKEKLAWAMDKALREGALKTVPTGVNPEKIVVSDCWKKI